jgi:NADP-reducing hydrogenase subunit HndB
MAKMSLDDLRKLRDVQKTELRKRDVEGKEIQIIVGMGTCGLAAGAREIMGVFLREVDERKLVDSVVVRQVGCMGMCHSEPTVEVLVPGMPPIIYGSVDSAAAKEIVEKHVVGRELLDGRIIDRPAADIMKA